MGVESFKSGVKVCTKTKRFPKCRRKSPQESNVLKVGWESPQGCRVVGMGVIICTRVEGSHTCKQEFAQTLESSRGNALELRVISFFKVVIHYIPCKSWAFNLVLWVSFQMNSSTMRMEDVVIKMQGILCFQSFHHEGKDVVGSLQEILVIFLQEYGHRFGHSL
jgi:hypothetical protein